MKPDFLPLQETDESAGGAAAPAEPAEEWTPPTQEEYQQLQAENMAARAAGLVPEDDGFWGEEEEEEDGEPDYFQGAYQPQQPQYAPDGQQELYAAADELGIDMNDPRVSRFFDEMVGAAVQQEVAPVMEWWQQTAPLVEAANQVQGEALTNQTFDRISEHLGDFDRGMAGAIASTFAQQGMPGAAAVFQAAQMVHQHDQEVGQKAVEAYKAQLAAQPPAQPNAGAYSPMSPAASSEEDTYQSVMDRFLARQRGGAVLP